MKIGATGVLAFAGVAVAGYLIYRGYKTTGKISQEVSQVFDNIGQKIDYAAKLPTHYWNQATNQQEPGDPVRAALYGNSGYAGIDQYTGQRVDSGEWYSDPEALRYENAQREAGRMPAATSINGAAFGIYPNALPQRGAVYVSTEITDRAMRESRMIDRLIEAEQQRTYGATGTW